MIMTSDTTFFVRLLARVATAVLIAVLVRRVRSTRRARVDTNGGSF